LEWSPGWPVTVLTDTLDLPVSLCHLAAAAVESMPWEARLSFLALSVEGDPLRQP